MIAIDRFDVLLIALVVIALIGLIIINLFYLIIKNLEKMGQELDDLKTAVAAEDTVIASAETLLTGLKGKLDAAIAANDPAALKALSDDIGAQTAALSKAVSDNTPGQ